MFEIKKIDEEEDDDEEQAMRVVRFACVLIMAMIGMQLGNY